MNKSYSELILLPTFEERFVYLKLEGFVGYETFGPARFLNQQFYKSIEYLNLRRNIIIRDNGCDLAIPGEEIYGTIIVHHIIPITRQMVERKSKLLLDPENVICTRIVTHNAIHYSDLDSLGSTKPVIREKNDTIPWR